ncbi:hypothetical protein LJ739_04545 [Aestuariibacter halophilus]|uniref:Phosphatidate cytidylyltransferase n=1 Tax=Fluctibacter halophilus TaxID=226011 RepID=A0ABS8G4Q8_9ALTE|nr:hypothetical protein [Aestuariibacter halophilus]MCC2615508.1 hypothetical protein [Aestuariibacter halophilus]
MKTLFRGLLLLALLIGALSAYSYGSTTGMFLFIVIGFCLEAGFWFGLLPRKRRQ